MEDKIFDLMTKMYAEMQDMNKTLNARIDTIQKDVSEVKSIQMRMEQDLGVKIEALFDAREVQIDVDEKVANNLQRVETKVDKLELKVIRHNFSSKNSVQEL